MKKKLGVFISILTSFAMVIMAISAINPAEVKGAGEKVGLITNGPVDDNGWNQLAYEGLVKAETDWGITKAVYIATGDPMDYGAAVNACVAAGNGLCIATSGWGFSGPMEATALANPSIKFAIIDQDVGDTPPANLRGVRFMEKQAGYLAGSLAGKMTSSNIVGAVGGIAFPAVVDFLEGYENGAQCANDSVIVLEKYTGTFSNPSLGASTAAEMIASGADVIFGAAGDTGNGAILYAAQQDKWVIGVDTDQYFSVFGNGSVDGSDMLLTSAMKRLDNAVYGTIYDFLNPSGTFGGTVYYGINEGGVSLAPYHETDSAISAEIKQYIEDVATKIKNDEISVDNPCAVSVWHPYSDGSNDAQALQDNIADFTTDNPTYPRIIASFHPDTNEFYNAVNQGWGPDLYIGSNDELSHWVDDEIVMDLTSRVTGKMGNFYNFAITGLTLGGKVYGVPESSVVVGLYYNKSQISTPPATTAELDSLVTAGKKLFAAGGWGSYYYYGFWHAFGGSLLNNNGLCVADQGGVVDAMQYLLHLQDTGNASLELDYATATDGFYSGAAAMTINGPWILPQGYGELGTNLGVAMLPNGSYGSWPLTGLNAIYINGKLPSPPEVLDILVDLALGLTDLTSSQRMTDNAMHVPVRSDIVVTDANIATFKQIASQGNYQVRPRVMDNYWEPFNLAIPSILKHEISPFTGIKTACDEMNLDNEFPSLSGGVGLADATITYNGGKTYSNSSGNYIFYIVPGWTGKITPAKTGYSFSPVSRSITTPVTYSLIGLNFTPSNKPGVFYKTSPANNAVNQPPKITLKWGASINSTSYEYCLQKVIGSGTTCSTGWKSTGTTKYVTRTGLTAGSWYWQVRAKNAKGATYANNGTWWKFTIPPKPGTFSKVSPVNNAIKQPTALALKWGTSTNAVKYEYCIDTTAGTTCTTSWKSTKLNKFVNLTGLMKDKKYYWMVRAVNAMGTTLSNAGVWWNFTTKP